MATAEHREPCDSRGSCTVLGAPGGEIPSGDSTILTVPGSGIDGELAPTTEVQTSSRVLSRCDTGEWAWFIRQGR